VDLFTYRRTSGNVCTSEPPVVPSDPESCNVNISGCGGSQENSNRCSINLAGVSECTSWFEACTGFLETDESEVWVEIRHVGGGVATFDLKLRNNGDNDTLTCANY
jgi:hypothetical protein